MNEFVQIISTIGFPIACCLGMAWFFKYITDKDREERLKLSDQHNAEMKDVTLALHNINVVLQKLCEKLENVDHAD